MNYRKLSLLLLALVVFSFAVGVVFGQTGSPRIKVTGATAIREDDVEQPAVLSEVPIDVASRVLLTGASGNTRSLILYPIGLESFILDNYLDRIIIQGASANRNKILERPSFLADVTVSNNVGVEPSDTTTTTPTTQIIGTATATLTNTPEPLFTQTSTVESLVMTTAAPATPLSADVFNTPNVTREFETPIPTETPAVFPTPVEIEAALIANRGVIIAAIITAVATVVAAILAVYWNRRGK